MTADKHRKRAARELAAAEGISYTAARRRVQRPAPPADPSAAAFAESLAPRAGGPWIPSWDGDPLHDVNSACGHHLRALCGGCGVCTTCDGCYCAELADEAAIDAEIEQEMREHQEHRREHRDDCERCERDRRETADYTRCPACALPYPDGFGDHRRHNPPYCDPLPVYRLGTDWGYLRGQHVTLVGPSYTITGYVLPDQESPDPHDYYPYLQMRRTDPGYEGEVGPVCPRTWREVHPAPPQP